jgi:hypothetical protein
MRRRDSSLTYCLYVVGVDQEATAFKELPCHLVVFGLHVEVDQ